MQNRFSSDDDCTVFSSIATANPEFTVPQDDAAQFMLRTTGLSESLRKRIPQIYEKSSIDQRHTCLEDYTRAFSEFDFYPKSSTLTPSPSTGARNRVYQQESIPLASRAAAESLQLAGLSAASVTHLIVVSCTGFFAPGLDIHLTRNLGLPPDTQRTLIGFMGCYAAFNAMRLADTICRSQSDAVVLIVCIELCTLHFQIEDSLESVVVNALFSDGAAAAVMQRVKRQDTENKLIYRDGQSLLHEDSLNAMSWAIGDTGFIMGLSPKVPELIASSLPTYVEHLLTNKGIKTADLDFWAVHPGGRQVLDRTASVMNIAPEQMSDSYAVLRENGNMSSPTILYILKQIMNRRTCENNIGETHQRYGIALAFGPGLTIEGCLLEIG
jgi:alpha-pyrone synthase